MRVKALDHVNIIAMDLEGTVRFYEELLGLRRRENLGIGADLTGAWMYDAADRPIVHLVGYSAARHGDPERGPATGWIDHVAFVCEDFAGMRARCEALGVSHRVNDRKYGDLRQIFVTDPNDVTLELNFRED